MPITGPALAVIEARVFVAAGVLITAADCDDEPTNSAEDPVAPVEVAAEPVVPRPHTTPEFTEEARLVGRMSGIELIARMTESEGTELASLMIDIEMARVVLTIAREDRVVGAECMGAPPEDTRYGSATLVYRGTTSVVTLPIGQLVMA